jgi:sugar phosphate isomerase/epimerase
MHRRTFLQTLTAPAFAAQSGGRIRLGYDTYSIRAFKLKALEHLDLCEKWKLSAIQISSLGDFESLEPAHLAKVKHRAAEIGVSIDAGIGCICPLSTSWNAREGDPRQYLSKGLVAAKAVGARSMRCYLGASADRRGKYSMEQLIEATVKALKTARSLSLDNGVKIAVENHSGDMQARELRTLIEQAGPDYVSACLDTGNPMHVVEDPLVALEVLAPYVITTHIRDSAVWDTPQGIWWQWVAMGDGSVDFKRFVKRYREVCPNAAMQLEVITGRPPALLRCYEPEFWKAFPKADAAEFARFVALAKNGKPYLGPMMIGGAGKQPAAFEAALKEQQMTDLERSLAYAKTIL